MPKKLNGILLFILYWLPLFVLALDLQEIEIQGQVEHISDGDTVVVSLSDPVMFSLLTTPAQANFLLANQELNEQSYAFDFFSLGMIKQQASKQGIPHQPQNKKRLIKIRVAQIDAPEYRYKGRENQCQSFGKESREGLLLLAPIGTTVTIVIDAIDKYSRYVGNIYRNDIWINQEMVKQGFAWVYKKYRKDKVLDAIEDEARKNKVGIWQEKDPMPPWQWRTLNKPKQPERVYQAELINVLDGHQLQIKNNGRTCTFILADIYLPVETQFSQLAKDYLETITDGKKQLSYTSVKYYQSSCTIIGYAYYENPERSFNHQLVEQGLAWVFPRYVAADSSLYQLQEAAKLEQKGFWEQPNPSVPWLEQIKLERKEKLTFLAKELNVDSFSLFEEQNKNN